MKYKPQAKLVRYMLTGYLITGEPLVSELAQEKWFQIEPSAHISPFGFVGWLYFRTIRTYKPFRLCRMVIFEALVGCHDILILNKSPIKWRRRPDMTLAVGWDVNHQGKQRNKLVIQWL